MNTASFDWLITARSGEDFNQINEILNATSIRFDENIVVSFPNVNHRPNARALRICDGNFLYKTSLKSTSPKRIFLTGSSIITIIADTDTGMSRIATRQNMREIITKHQRDSEI